MKKLLRPLNYKEFTGKKKWLFLPPFGYASSNYTIKNKNTLCALNVMIFL